ncbi:MAG: phage portal protein [Rhizobacter sp.]
MALRVPPVPQNLLDKAIAYVAPRVAQRRLAARQMLALSGGYTGARIDRAATAAWRTSAGSPQSDVIVDLPMLRARSADLERNAPVATGIVNTTVTHVVGTGLACNPQIEASYLNLTEEQATEWQNDTKRRFKAWADSADCDLARKLNFYGIQELALRTTLSRGDSFAITPRVARAGKKPKIAIQLIEADLCCNKSGQRDTDTLTDGIEHSPDTGEAIGYWFVNRLQGDMLGGAVRSWTRVAARGDSTGRRNVLHLYKQLRPSLRRGVPMLAPVIEPLKQLSTYTDAELSAAVASGLFPLFAKMDPDAFQEMFDEESQKSIIDRAGKWTGEIESAKVTNLLPGEEIISPNPGRPNAQFDPFVSSCIRQIGMSVGIPYEVLIMHYQSSYSAARGALLMAWRFFMGWRDWMSTSLCQPVYELWLADEVAEGRIAAPGFFADDVVRYAWSCAQWVGDGPGSIDPQKEVGAAKDRVELEISTLQAESLLHDGVDWETKHRQRVKELRLQRDDDTLTSAPPPAPAPAEPPPPPEDQTQKDQSLATLELTRALIARASEPAVAPSITIAPAAITVEPSPVNITSPDINVSPHIFVEPSPAPRSESPDLKGRVRKVPERDERGLIKAIAVYEGDRLVSRLVPKRDHQGFVTELAEELNQTN